MIGSILTGIVTFIAFGYAEKVYNAGFVATVAVSAYAYSNKKSWIILFLCLIHIIMTWYQFKQAGVLVFLFLDILLIIDAGSESSSIYDNLDSVEFKPHEREIRQFLFKNNPKMLHEVDTLLFKFEGREDELLELVMKGNFLEKDKPSATKLEDKDEYPIDHQIRDLIKLKNPTILHTVDHLLKRWSGREDELLYQLKAEFEITPNPRPNASNQVRQRALTRRDSEKIEDSRWEVRNEISKKTGWLY